MKFKLLFACFALLLAQGSLHHSEKEFEVPSRDAISENPEAVLPSATSQTGIPELPIRVPDNRFKPLDACRDRNLERSLERQLLRDPVFARLVGT
ncbi:MAG: hypothetical protein R3252_03210, partial [Robiginitalea sp.]|nr:hypothetical protein [Robiginitalea sp.]